MQFSTLIAVSLWIFGLIGGVLWAYSRWLKKRPELPASGTTWQAVTDAVHSLAVRHDEVVRMAEAAMDRCAEMKEELREHKQSVGGQISNIKRRLDGPAEKPMDANEIIARAVMESLQAQESGPAPVPEGNPRQVKIPVAGMDQ